MVCDHERVVQTSAPERRSQTSAPRWRGTATALAAGLCGFAIRYLSFDQFSNDHFAHLSRAQQILMGEWPVRDFVETGFPLMSLLSAGAQVVLGPGLHSELLFIAAVYGISIALLAGVAARLSGWASAGAVAAVLIVLASPLSYSYPKFLPYAMVFVALAAFAHRPSRVRAAAVGIAVGIAFLLRHDHGVILGGAGLLALVLHPEPWRVRRAALVSLCLGAAALIVPYLAWVQAYEGVAAYMRDGIAFSQRESSKADWSFPRPSLDRRMPLVAWTRLADPPHAPAINIRWAPAASDALQRQREQALGLTRTQTEGERTWRYELSRTDPDALRAIVKDQLVEDTQGIDRRAFALLDPPRASWASRVVIPLPAPGLNVPENAAVGLFYLAWGWALAGAVMVALSWTREPAALRTCLLLLVLVQVGMNLTMLRDPLTSRVRDVLAPMAILMALAVSWRAAAASTSGLRLFRSLSVVIAMMTLIAAAAVGSFGTVLASTGVTRGWHGVVDRMAAIHLEFAPPHERTGRQDRAPMVQYLAACAPPGTRLLTVAFAPQLFFYTGHAFAAGQVALIPGYSTTPRADAEMVTRLSRQDVPFVILDRAFENEMQASWPRLTAIVRTNYTRALSVTEHLQTVDVLADRRRMPRGTFGEQQSPCFVAGSR
jgi:hypothetical protein